MVSEWREQQRAKNAAAVAQWLETLSDSGDVDDLYDELADHSALTPALRSVTGTDRYRAWSDYYDMTKHTSGRWTATCRTCGATCTRGPSVTDKGHVWKGAATNVMDLMERHVISKCTFDMTPKERPAVMPDEPPF
jgi:hypothetical protein